MNIILYNIIACLASLIIGYFFGSIPVGVILCRLFRGEDPREKGSKNSGGTNVGRVFGMKLGAVTILLDALKTILPMFLVWILLKFAGLSKIMVKNFGEDFYNSGSLIILFAPLGATIGHCWPIYLDFRGGKAVSNYSGFALFTCWLSFVVGFLSFGATLKKTKIVSISSMIGSIVATLCAWALFFISKFTGFDANLFFIGFGIVELWSNVGLDYAIVTTVMTLILIFRHRSNIKKLLNGCENKIKWMK